MFSALWRSERHDYSPPRRPPLARTLRGRGDLLAGLGCLAPGHPLRGPVVGDFVPGDPGVHAAQRVERSSCRPLLASPGGQLLASQGGPILRNPGL